MAEMIAISVCLWNTPFAFLPCAGRGRVRSEPSLAALCGEAFCVTFVDIVFVLLFVLLLKLYSFFCYVIVAVYIYVQSRCPMYRVRSEIRVVVLPLANLATVVPSRCMASELVLEARQDCAVDAEVLHHLVVQRQVLEDQLGLDSNAVSVVVTLRGVTVASFVYY